MKRLGRKDRDLRCKLADLEGMSHFVEEHRKLVDVAVDL